MVRMIGWAVCFEQQITVSCPGPTFPNVKPLDQAGNLQVGPDPLVEHVPHTAAGVGGAQLRDPDNVGRHQAHFNLQQRHLVQP